MLLLTSPSLWTKSCSSELLKYPNYKDSLLLSLVSNVVLYLQILQRLASVRCRTWLFFADAGVLFISFESMCQTLTFITLFVTFLLFFLLKQYSKFLIFELSRVLRPLISVCKRIFVWQLDHAEANGINHDHGFTGS